MIPEFPAFKNIELSDKEEIERFTGQYPSYSDFNFISMWSWDTKSEMEVSQLNNNLVIMFTDYISGEPFFSFLGTNKVNETANELLEFSIEAGLKPRLSLVPEISTLDLDKSKFRIEKDEDNFDYVYDLKQISQYPGNKFSDKRRMVNNFLGKYADHKVEILDLREADFQIKVIGLNDLWLGNKVKEDANFKIKNEFVATRRFLKSSFEDIIAVGMFINDRLVGYSIFATLPHNYAICHFCKADILFEGVYEYLMRESAKILLEKGCKLLNYEQDLGIPGLRQSKNSFRPVSFFKKYIIKFAKN
jgi:uncharacterized protein